MGSFWKYGFMSWEVNAKPYMLNDKGTKLNQNETLIQSRDSLHRNAWEGKPNASHVKFGCEFSFMLKCKRV